MQIINDNGIGMCIVEDGKKKSEKIKTGETEHDDDEKLSVATHLVQLAEQNCELFVNQNGDAHAHLKVGSHHEVYRVESKLFREWLSQTFWDNENIVVTDTTMKATLSTIVGIAKFTGDQRRVFLRIARMECGQVFLDLANESWTCVEILKNGWSIRSDPPVMFVRTANMRPLPEPSRSGDLDKLWSYVNVAEEDRLLLVAFLIECFRRQSPDPLLELTGLQGTAKSDSHRAIRKLIDPNRADLRSAPSKLDDDLLVPAANSLFVCFDNLSKLSDSMQDRLCSLSTGAGIASRKFYTNGEEFALDIQRPVIINGIIPMVTRPDLLDRTIAFEMPPLAERMAKTEIENAYEKDWPDMLGGLLDLLSVVLKLLPDIKISPRKLPRMADFAICGEAVYKACGKATGDFLKDYTANRLKSNQRSLDASSVGIALISYREQFPVNFEGVLFTGTMKKLLSKLEPHRPDGEIWIKSPKGLSNALRRLIPVLRMNGIRVDFDNKGLVYE